MTIIIIYSSYKEKRCLNLPPLSEVGLLHRGSGMQGTRLELYMVITILTLVYWGSLKLSRSQQNLHWQLLHYKNQSQLQVHYPTMCIQALSWVKATVVFLQCIHV